MPYVLLAAEHIHEAEKRKHVCKLKGTPFFLQLFENQKKKKKKKKKKDTLFKTVPLRAQVVCHALRSQKPLQV